MSHLRRLAAICCLAALCFGQVAQAKVLVVSEITTSAGYGATGAINTLVNLRMLRAVLQILDAYGADYRVVPLSAAKTEFCRTGQFTHNFNGTNGSYVESFDAVIHVGFNGAGTSTVTGYKPDSLTLTAKLPTVPQLMLIDDELINANGSVQNTTTDSTGVSLSGYLAPGQGTGNHEGEGCVYDAATGVYRWFDIIYGGHCLRASGSQNGGVRVLLSGGANAVMTNLEFTGNMPTFPESLSTANTDTMKVWEKLNSHKAGSARIVFATAAAAIAVDSTAAAGGGEHNEYAQQGINWPVLLYAMGHLDSLAGGAVLGNGKVLKWGAVIYGVGCTSDRRNAGGLFRADTTIAAASGDSVSRLGINVVLAADPESLRVNEGPAIWKHFGSVRWTPFVRLGIDTLALPAAGATSYSRPVDVFGRYRNRFFMGDGSATGADTSLWAILKGARDTLARVTGGPISGCLVPPDDDWSPYQMRAHQNYAGIDSFAIVAKSLGFSSVLTWSQNRDRDPAYLRTNPLGFIYGQKRHSIQNGRSLTFNFIAHSPTPTSGNRYNSNGDGLSFLGQLTDSIPPVCSPGPCPGANRAVVYENRFWNGFFGPSRDFDDYSSFSAVGDPYRNTWDVIYGQNKASVIYLPAQWFGGQNAAAPNRFGFFILKHLTFATRAINAGAWRPIIQNAFPEDIDP